jgi:hypothetical protein
MALYLQNRLPLGRVRLDRFRFGVTAGGVTVEEAVRLCRGSLLLCEDPSERAWSLRVIAEDAPEG